MFEIIVITVFVIGLCIIGLRVKKHLYCDEHVAAIGNELVTFNHNFNRI